jgi:MarR family transcriptional regulator, organic hydroperoxide resistance regulator
MAENERMTSPRSSPGFLFWGVSLSWQRQVARALKPLRLTHVQFVLLASTKWLSEESDSGYPSQRELSEHAGSDPMMTSTVIRALSERGLVVRIDDRTDARIRRIALTSQGTELVGQALEFVEAVDREFFGRVPDKEQMFAVLRTLAQP